MHGIISLIAGFILDLIFGDPYWFPHPVRAMGYLIDFLDKKLYVEIPGNISGEENASGEIESLHRKQMIAGGILVVLVLLISTVVPFGILFLAYRLHPMAGVIISSFMCYQLLAVKCLRVESMRVYDALKEGNLAKAREKVSMIVGRDTDNLDAKEVARAAVETVAENTSDGVAAPLFYMAIGGPVLGFFYKAVNTMDSMIGYKNERYLYFGRFAARLDDVMNYIPARLCAVLMIVVSFLPGFMGRNALYIYRRDRHNQTSPNAGQTEAVCAGALGIQIGGANYYFGKRVEKPTIGEPYKEMTPDCIKRAVSLLYGTAFLLLLCAVGFKLIMYFV